jgi:hypothetical protein
VLRIVVLPLVDQVGRAVFGDLGVGEPKAVVQEVRPAAERIVEQIEYRLAGLLRDITIL